MRTHKTISLSLKQFQWARKQMEDNEWDRAGDDKGISRYVQELIKKDMPKDWQPSKKPAGSIPDKKVAGDTEPGKVQTGPSGSSELSGDRKQRPKRDRQKPSQN